MLPSDWSAPERASIGQGIKFVEQHSAVPQRFAFVVHIRRLPRINLPRSTCSRLSMHPSRSPTHSIRWCRNNPYNAGTISVPDPNSATGRSQAITIGTIFFSPGSSVNRNAIAPAIRSPLLVQESLLFASLPSCANGFQTSSPVTLRTKCRLITQFHARLRTLAMANCPSHSSVIFPI